MTLWILFCRMSKDVDTLFTFYAKDRHHAELKAEELLDWYGYERIELKAYPGGFRMAFTTTAALKTRNGFDGWSTSDKSITRVKPRKPFQDDSSV